MSTAVGLLLQLVGTALAGWALVGEWRDDTMLAEPDRAKKSRRRLENPWTAKLDLPSLRRRPARPSHDLFRLGREPINEDTIQLAEYLVTWLKKRESKLAADWKWQRELDDGFQADLSRLFNEQARLVREGQTRTRRRVLTEMGGLVLVAVGTIIGSL